MPEWWHRWFSKSPMTAEYDQFVAHFARKFEKEHQELYRHDVQEYWRLFRIEKEKAWLDYQTKK